MKICNKDKYPVSPETQPVSTAARKRQ